MSLWPSASLYQRYFAGDYATARRNWLHQAQGSAWSAHQRSFAHPLTGPDGESLASDCLWYGPADATRAIVLLSGTHGVEGYAGSAVQSFLLEGLNQRRLTLPAGVALLFVHALTPWGMAWYRRCDEHGIDLNRHFVDFSEPPPLNSNFELIRPCLAQATPAARRRALARVAAQLGRKAYDMAVSGGQYVDPDAPFYGGTAPNHGRRVIEQLMADYALAARDLLVLDLHTGLGPWSYGELICDHPSGTPGVAVARALFGANVVQPELGTSASVPKIGLLDYAWHAIMNDRSCFLTLEFGTYSTDDLFERVIEDHRHWARAAPCDRSDRRWQRVRRRIVEHFCPADPYWRASVLVRSLQVLQRALEGAEAPSADG